MNAVQVYDGDGVTGAPTLSELMEAGKNDRRRRLDRALQLAREHNIILTAEDYDTYTYPVDYSCSDGILIMKIEELFGCE